MTADRIAYLMELRSELLALDRLERKMRAGATAEDDDPGQLSLGALVPLTPAEVAKAARMPLPPHAADAMPLDPPGRS